MTTVTTRKSLLTPAERRRIRVLSDRLRRHFGSLLSVEWDFEQEGLEHRAACRVHSRSGYYRAKAASERYGKSMDMVFDKLTKQRRRTRKIAVAKRRDTGP